MLKQYHERSENPPKSGQMVCASVDMENVEGEEKSKQIENELLHDVSSTFRLKNSSSMANLHDKLNHLSREQS